MLRPPIQGKTFDDTWKENGKIIEKGHGVTLSEGPDYYVSKKEWV